MPCADAATLQQNAKDLAVSAPETVKLLCDRLAPASERKNNLAEYAISSVVAYVANPDNAERRNAVREGLRQGITAQADGVNRNFLLGQLRLIASPEDIYFFAGYADDKDCASTAIAALGDSPEGKAVVLDLVGRGAADKTLLSRAVARLGLKEAEPQLLAWAAASSGAEKAALCSTLGKIGSEASASFLKANSKADYAALVNNLPDKKALSAAKSLLKDESSGIRCSAARTILSKAPANDGLKVLAACLKSTDRALRNTALAGATESYGKKAVAAVVEKYFYKVPGVTQIDLVNWMGANKTGNLDLVINAMNGQGELGRAAIRAAGQFGTDAAADALIGCLGTDKSAAALEALCSFNGKIDDKVCAAMLSSDNQDKTADLVKLAGLKQIKSAGKYVITYSQAKGAAAEFAKGKVQAAALEALPGVVTEKNVDEMAAALASETVEANVPYRQAALVSALHTLSPAEQTDKVKTLIVGSSNRNRFYPVLASTGTDDAVVTLRSLTSQDKAAKDALLSMGNPGITPDLLAAAKEGGASADKYLEKYIDMLASYEQDNDIKRFGLSEAIGLTKSSAVKVQAINRIGEMPLMKTFLLAGKYLGDSNEDVRMAAAGAVKKIASKSVEEINYDDFKANLEKARDLFKARGWADDGYAVDEINKMLLEAVPSPRSELTAEEKAQGFEMLFDGTDLSKWHGDMEGYTVVNGAIYVSANYGSTGNLYTNKEYRNFIYRFEFCFLEEGVNNGVGVRTPENVDAAYHGMCELQILDHDAPAYAGWLRDYQVHGSIYGIVPAKRIKHKPLGQWSTEEIIVEGDHITVKVNGEVITDADIRKVTKGHNMAPDGGDVNPYTIDGHNHPGMFNYKGHLSFCGHGAGLKIRNVRILDLGYKK